MLMGTPEEPIEEYKNRVVRIVMPSHTVVNKSIKGQSEQGGYCDVPPQRSCAIKS